VREPAAATWRGLTGWGHDTDTPGAAGTQQRAATPLVGYDYEPSWLPFACHADASLQHAMRAQRRTSFPRRLPPPRPGRTQPHCRSGNLVRVGISNGSQELALTPKPCWRIRTQRARLASQSASRFHRVPAFQACADGWTGHGLARARAAATTTASRGGMNAVHECGDQPPRERVNGRCVQTMI
jgi:hypothetical protein